MSEKAHEFIPGSEPTYVIITDKKRTNIITDGLKKAGFEKGTSYILMQSNKNELLIQITGFEGKGVANTGIINLQIGMDFIMKDGSLIITPEGIKKMQLNYVAIQKLVQEKSKITSSVQHTLEDTLTA